MVKKFPIVTVINTFLNLQFLNSDVLIQFSIVFSNLSDFSTMEVSVEGGAEIGTCLLRKYDEYFAGIQFIDELFN